MASLASHASSSAARIDWELLPSLRNLLSTRRGRSQPTWMDTVPSEMDPPVMSGPFEEALPGLSVRELREPDIFTAFFG